mgnify:CR=1 FL=1
MKKELVWIHCRFSNFNQIALLDEHKEMLEQYASINDYQVAGHTYELSNEIGFKSTFISNRCRL